MCNNHLTIQSLSHLVPFLKQCLVLERVAFWGNEIRRKDIGEGVTLLKSLYNVTEFDFFQNREDGWNWGGEEEREKEKDGDRALEKWMMRNRLSVFLFSIVFHFLILILFSPRIAKECSFPYWEMDHLLSEGRELYPHQHDVLVWMYARELAALDGGKNLPTQTPKNPY